MTERTRLLSTLVALSLASPAAHAEPTPHTPAQHEGIVRVTGVVATPTTHDDDDDDASAELRALQARIRAAKAKRAIERARTRVAKSQAAADRAAARARSSAAKLADLEARAAK